MIKKKILNTAITFYWVLLISLLSSYSVFATHEPRELRIKANSKTIMQVIRHAMFTNPDVLQSTQLAYVAGDKITAAQAAYLPKVDSNLGIGREQVNSPSTLFLPTTLTREQKQISASQLLWDGWGTIFQIRSAVAQYKTSLYQAVEKKQLTGLRAAEVFLDMLRFSNNLSISQEDVNYEQQIFNKVNLRFKGGAGQKADVELAKSSLAFARSTLIGLQGSLLDAKANFIQVVGYPPRNLQLPRLATIPKTLAMALEIARVNNPSIRAARHQLSTALQNVNVAHAAFYPRFSLEGSVARDRNDGGLRGTNSDTVGMVMMRYNLANGGADLSALHQSVHQVGASRAALWLVNRQVKQNVTTAWNDTHNALRRTSQLQERVEAQQRVFKAYEKQFELGQRSLIDLISTERELYSARVDLLNAKFLALNSSYQLLAAMGTLGT